MPTLDPAQPTVVLIDPPYYRLYKDTYSLQRYPLALGYLAAQIRARSTWNVVVYNADFRPDSEPYHVSYLSGPGFQRYRRMLEDAGAPIWTEITSVVRRYRPRVVGLSCKSQTFASAVRVAEIVKRLDPATRVVVGGPHAAMAAGAILDCPHVDAVVRGEGEQTIVELLEAWAAGRSPAGVAGVIHRDGAAVVAEAPRALMADLDELPYPHVAAPEVLHDYELYGPDAFSHVFATRGCPYSCFFCGSRHVWTRRVRHRSVDNVVGEMDPLIRSGVSHVHFDDDTFGVSRERIVDLCEAIHRRCPGASWSCELHVNLIDDATMAAMAAAGCRSIQIGIESGNNEMLRAIRKGITIEQALDACRTVDRHGIETQAFFMVGFPQETEKTLADTVAAMKQVRGILSYSIFTPYPGTEAFDYCHERDLVDDDFDVALHNHQSPHNCFCEHIAPERFRQLVGRIERRVDRHNRPGPLRRVLTGRESLTSLFGKGVRRLTGRAAAAV
ncbi:MAG: B12-binding domain-containing radical SAM protein [Planctomycetota bacterium]